MKNLLFIIIAILLMQCSDEKTYNEVFVLSFEEGYSVEYDYKQIAFSDMQMDCDDESDPNKISMEGTLEIKGTSDTEASLIMKDMTLCFNTGDETNPSERDTMHQEEMKIDGLRIDGSIDNMPEGDMFSILFALPSEDIDVGESVVNVVLFPIRLRTPTTSIEAHKTITYVKDTVIDGVDCAVLEFDILNQGIQDKTGFTKDSYGRYSGNGRSYFDKAHKEFIGGKFYMDIKAVLTMTEEDPISECFITDMKTNAELWKK